MKKPCNVKKLCAVCRHPERPKIDELLAGGMLYEIIARHYGVPHKHVQRHAYHRGVSLEEIRGPHAPVSLTLKSGRTITHYQRTNDD
jgi:hypothetical protein